MKHPLLLGTFALALPLAAAAAPESYTIDPYHTYPYFQVSHFGVGNMMGRFDKTTGKLALDSAAKTGSVDLAVETATLTTGDNERGSRPRTRDEHLRTADFFNVQEFPRMTFKGTAVKFNGEAPAQIDGELTLIGVTKPLTLTVDNWKCMPDPRTKGQRFFCGGNASGMIKRSDFGMKFGIPAVSDEVKLSIMLEAFRD
ncbi:MAG: YceI family protein [Pseudomonadota bacterium]|nr:YceI family protein [Pseudomonadota bacterium]